MTSSCISKLSYSPNTSPLISLKRITFNDDIRCRIFVKTLHQSITGSSKDDLAKFMLNDLEKSGDINSDTVLISYSSGNLSISLAYASVEKKYKTVSVLPFCTSQEKLSCLYGLGSKVILGSPPPNYVHANCCHFITELVLTAQKIHQEIPNSYLFHPDEDSLASQLYYEEISNDIISQSDGRLNVLVCSAETLGMISQLSKNIKKVFPSCKIIGIQTIMSEAEISLKPSPKSRVESEIEGVGCPYNELHLPIVASKSIDDWITVKDKTSLCTYFELMKSDGLLTGASSGAVIAGAVEAVEKCNLREENEATVVIIIQEALEHTKTEFLNENVLMQKNYLTDTDFAKKKWWWGVFIGNLKMKAPLIITKETTVGSIVESCEMKNGIILDGTTIVGVVTPELKIVLEAMSEHIYDAFIGNVPGCYCTDFKIINHSNTTLGDISLILKESTHLIVTASTEIVIKDNKGGTQGIEIVETVVGILTNMDLLTYITMVEGHHRKQSNWDVKTNTLIE